MPKERLTPDERRALVLAALSGVPVLQLSEKYEVARSWIYVLLEEARADPEGKLDDAYAELRFRQAAVALQRSSKAKK